MKTQKPSTNITSNKRRVFVAILIIAALAGGIYLTLELIARNRFNNVNNSVEKIQAQVISPLGGVELIVNTNGSELPYIRGDNLFSTSGCIDVRCPQVVREWFVPFDPGSEEQFVKSLIQSQGYQVTEELLRDCHQLDKGNQCRVYGAKDKLILQAQVKAQGDLQSPANNISPKQWRLVEVRAYYD